MIINNFSTQLSIVGNSIKNAIIDGSAIYLPSIDEARRLAELLDNRTIKFLGCMQPKTNTHNRLETGIAMALAVYTTLPDFWEDFTVQPIGVHDGVICRLGMYFTALNNAQLVYEPLPDSTTLSEINLCLNAMGYMGISHGQ